MNQSEHGEVLAEGLNGVADDGHVAAPGADEGGIGTRREHPRQAVLAEAMAALKQKGDSFFLVVARLADGAARHFHLPDLASSTFRAESIEIGFWVSGFRAFGELRSSCWKWRK